MLSGIAEKVQKQRSAEAVPIGSKSIAIALHPIYIITQI
jgi:hypothetical protein